MGFLAPFIPLIAAGIGGGLSGRKSARTQTQSSSTAGTVTPIEDPAFADLKELLLSQAEGRLDDPVDLRGFEGTGLANINRTFDLINQAQTNRLTSLGLSRSPVAGAGSATLEGARGGSMAQFLNSLPLLRRQFEQQNFQNALNLFGQQPIGKKTTGSSEGEIVFPGSVAGSAFADIGAILGFQTGQGNFGGSGSGDISSSVTNPFQSLPINSFTNPFSNF